MADIPVFNNKDMRNSVTLIMRLQQSFERLILIIIYAPVTNLNFTDVYLDKTINNHYLSMILGLAKKAKKKVMDLSVII